MLELLIIPLTAILAGYAGGSLPFSHLLDKIYATWLPEALFAILLSFAVYHEAGYIIAGLVSIWVYIWMQTGHANALGRGKNATDERVNTLSPFVRWLADKVGIERYGRKYSNLFFGVKGFLMGLPFGGIIPAILWPLAYDIGTSLWIKAGWQNKHAHAVSELLSGAFLGAWVYVLTQLLGTL